MVLAAANHSSYLDKKKKINDLPVLPHSDLRL